MGVMSEPSAGEWAASVLNQNATTTQDALVLIGWLAKRVSQLESLVHPDQRIPFPEMPSRMTGFACLPRREAAVKEAMTEARNG